MLEDLINELGWRGGTKHQALAEVRRLIHENQSFQAQRDQAIKEIGNMGQQLGVCQAKRDELLAALKNCETWFHDNGEHGMQDYAREVIKEARDA